MVYQNKSQIKVLDEVQILPYDVVFEGQEWNESEDMPLESLPDISNHLKSLYSIFPKEVLTAKLSATQRLVYAAIKSYYRPNSPTIPSIRRIAEDIGVVRRTVERAIKALEEAGLLKREGRRRADGGITSNAYTLSDAPCDNMSHPLRQNVAYPPDLNVASSRFKCRIEEEQFKNNNIFKKYNITRARTRKNAAGDMPETSGTPEQTDIEDYTQNNRDTSILQALQSLGKGMEWLQLLRANGKYYLRPASAKAFNYVTDEQFEYFRKNAEMLAGSCHGLKWGQWLPNEILIKEIK